MRFQGKCTLSYLVFGVIFVVIPSSNFFCTAGLENLKYVLFSYTLILHLLQLSHSRPHLQVKLDGKYQINLKVRNLYQVTFPNKNE